MKSKTALILAAAGGLAFANVCAHAAAKSCDDLKTEIAAKLDAKKIAGYGLEVVEAGKADANAKVVGTCEHGARKIVYTKK
jgi:hypothetical protein